MAASLPATLSGRWRPGARFLARVGRRTIVESLYLLTALVTAVAALAAGAWALTRHDA